MRAVLLIVMCLPLVAPAQSSDRFQRALRSERAMDHWIKREVHHQRKGQRITTPSTSYVVHHGTFDSLVAFCRRQPGVEDAAWDGCVAKIMLWPGQSTVGLRWVVDGRTRERCWHVQEGRPGTLALWGWRPQVRKAREQLVYKGARECPGFVEEQRRHCAAERDGSDPDTH